VEVSGLEPPTSTLRRQLRRTLAYGGEPPYLVRCGVGHERTAMNFGVRAMDARWRQLAAWHGTDGPQGFLANAGARRSAILVS
jgi:hypothetical protein